MILKDSKLFFLLFLISFSLSAQYKVSGFITDAETKLALSSVEIYDKNDGALAQTNSKGYYEFQTTNPNLHLIVFTYGYKLSTKLFSITQDVTLNIELETLSEALSEVEVTARKAEIFSISRLKDVEETAIYAGKKTEVVLVEQSMANLAANNARQIYSQVAGLNIYQNDDAGLQLNIGGRGLDPNRTANFNTRQNGYDISADVLGYPESYYTPAAEALKEVQIVRGAASLQYGTQFGGLINFVMKTPNPNKPFEVVLRNTIGSYGLYTNFTSISGTKNKFSYYTFYNYKKGDGFRPNSQFESHNLYAHIGYKFTPKTKLTGEITYLDYLAQQAGGLDDVMYAANPFQSNRSRNWFSVNWLLYNLKLSHEFSENTHYTFNFFGLNAKRNALGFRENRVSTVDAIDLSTNEFKPRDLIKGDFNNFGFETRLLHKYTFLTKKATFLIGGKFYKAENTAIQGPGSNKSNADFSFATANYPNYANQSNYIYPNLNTAIFGENIIYLNKKVSINPGFRIEHIKTESAGFYKEIIVDKSDKLISNITYNDANINQRSFILLGLGASYKPNSSIEAYGNASQNYRSVTFTDISIINPSFSIAPNITDEKGFTIDLGLRGEWNKKISYDIGAFGLFYNDRIGITIQKNGSDTKTVRGNVGDAVMYGFESLIDLNLNELIIKNPNYICSYFINSSFIDSEYLNSEIPNVKGNKVEFIPRMNIKTGIKLGYKNLLSSIQYTYLSSQFTDASNSPVAGLTGVSGLIPTYDVVDLSLSYSYKKFKLEAGINNLLNEVYFTRRATGYPGPGIIPSANRNFYTTLQIKL